MALGREVGGGFGACLRTVDSPNNDTQQSHPHLLRKALEPVPPWSGGGFSVRSRAPATPTPSPTNLFFPQAA